MKLMHFNSTCVSRCAPIENASAGRQRECADGGTEKEDDKRIESADCRRSRSHRGTDYQTCLGTIGGRNFTSVIIERRVGNIVARATVTRPLALAPSVFVAEVRSNPIGARRQGAGWIHAALLADRLILPLLTADRSDVG